MESDATLVSDDWTHLSTVMSNIRNSLSGLDTLDENSTGLTIIRPAILSSSLSGR